PHSRARHLPDQLIRLARVGRLQPNRLCARRAAVRGHRRAPDPPPRGVAQHPFRFHPADGPGRQEPARIPGGATPAESERGHHPGRRVGSTPAQSEPATGTDSASRARCPSAADPAVITTWNALAIITIAGPAPNGAGKANAEGVFWFGFVQAAVYNAVVGITGEYDLYKWNARAPKGASPQAAAAVAAHRILKTFFRTSA